MEVWMYCFGCLGVLRGLKGGLSHTHCRLSDIFCRSSQHRQRKSPVNKKQHTEKSACNSCRPVVWWGVVW